jgi:hypothetical protein
LLWAYKKVLIYIHLGYQVALIARNAEPLKKIAAEINLAGGDVSF